MPVQLKQPWHGIAIPCSLIFFIGYPAHWFILRNSLSNKRQIIFQFCLTMIWISYYMAIYTNPGKPPHGSAQQHTDGDMNRYCAKCNGFKPERSHHCKTCQQCVLMMDHHCPWTMNCLGFGNFPQFMRFLIWVIITTSQLFWYLLLRIAAIWQARNMPIKGGVVSTTTKELVSLVVLTPMDLFVLFTITALFVRCVTNQVIGGMTQIESWEMERLQNMFYSKKLLPIMIERVWEKFPHEQTPEHELEAEKLLEMNEQGLLKFSSVVNFPYDVDLLTNIHQSLGSPMLLLWPFSTAQGNGVTFQKNDISTYEDNLSISDLLLCLSWPPDGGRRIPHPQREDGAHMIDQTVEDGEFMIRKRNSPIESRTTWENQWGETLEGFGVDPMNE